MRKRRCQQAGLSVSRIGAAYHSLVKGQLTEKNTRFKACIPLLVNANGLQLQVAPGLQLALPLRLRKKVFCLRETGLEKAGAASWQLLSLGQAVVQLAL